MPEIDDRVNQWLRDAHAMEQQAESMLTGLADRIENYPEAKKRIERHVEETRSHKERVEKRLDARGESPSTVKDMTGKAGAWMQNMGHAATSDEIVKAAIASFAFENFEYASYRNLATAAETAGDHETARVCEEICREEKAMGDWLSEHMPKVTESFLRSEAVGERVER